MAGGGLMDVGLLAGIYVLACVLLSLVSGLVEEGRRAQ